MSRPSKKLVDRSGEILKRLDKAHADAKCPLVYRTPLQLLVATILSAQCTDERVNLVTPGLFKKYKTALDFAQADPVELEKAVQSTGFYRNKAKSVRECCRRIVEDLSGKVPKDMDLLVTLPGVGRKTANVVRGHAFGEPAIIVDTHVIRLSHRLELSKEEDPDKIEQDLRGLIPEGSWTRFSLVLGFHGRRICVARKPRCEECVIADLCPSAGK